MPGFAARLQAPALLRAMKPSRQNKGAVGPEHALG